MQHCGLRGACLPGALLHCGRDPGTQKCFGAGDVSAVDVKGGGWHRSSATPGIQQDEWETWTWLSMKAKGTWDSSAWLNAGRGQQ